MLDFWGIWKKKNSEVSLLDLSIYLDYSSEIAFWT